MMVMAGNKHRREVEKDPDGGSVRQRLVVRTRPVLDLLVLVADLKRDLMFIHLYEDMEEPTIEEATIFLRGIRSHPSY
jgi:hypothetical protein